VGKKGSFAITKISSKLWLGLDAIYTNYRRLTSLNPSNKMKYLLIIESFLSQLVLQTP
jgi:hypothetical protein